MRLKENCQSLTEPDCIFFGDFFGAPGDPALCELFDYPNATDWEFFDIQKCSFKILECVNLAAIYTAVKNITFRKANEKYRTLWRRFSEGIVVHHLVIYRIFKAFLLAITTYLYFLLLGILLIHQINWVHGNCRRCVCF